jgi:hypothetical protein
MMLANMPVPAWYAVAAASRVIRITVIMYMDITLHMFIAVLAWLLEGI